MFIPYHDCSMSKLLEGANQNLWEGEIDPPPLVWVQVFAGEGGKRLYLSDIAPSLLPRYGPVAYRSKCQNCGNLVEVLNRKFGT